MLILFISFFPFIFTTAFLLYRFDLAYTEKIHEHVSELIQNHALIVDHFISEKTGDVLYLKQEIENSSLNPEQVLKNSYNAFKSDSDSTLTDILILNEQGINIAHEGPIVDTIYTNMDWIRTVINSPIYVSDVFEYFEGRPHFVIAVKIVVNNVVYLLAVTFNFTEYSSMFEKIQIGSTGKICILNKAGQAQTKIDPPINGDIIVPMTQENHPEYEVIISEKTDADGNTFLYAISTLPATGWSAVFRQNKKDALSVLHKSILLTLILLLAGCVVVITVALILPRYIVNIIANADEKIETMNQKVIESGKIASIGELAAGVAHEINNPVSIMIEQAGWIEDLLEDEVLTDTENFSEFKRALRQINKQGKRCKEITHKLLSFARKTDSSAIDVNINEAIKEIVSLTVQMAKFNTVSIETLLGENLPLVRISLSEFQQVMLNLINNAIDAMENKGGVIVIKTEKNHAQKDQLTVSIEDNGPGISKENLSRIFDPFFTTKAVGKGTGLGLSICYGLVQKMGGKIEASSKLGIGTKFTIDIPCIKTSADRNANDHFRSEFRSANENR